MQIIALLFEHIVYLTQISRRPRNADYRLIIYFPLAIISLTFPDRRSEYLG
jgi:hypothetical protein